MAMDAPIDVRLQASFTNELNDQGPLYAYINALRDKVEELDAGGVGGGADPDDVTIELDLNGDLALKAGGISNTHVAADAAIALTKLAAITATAIPVADGSGFLAASSITLSANVVTHAASSAGDVSSAVTNSGAGDASFITTVGSQSWSLGSDNSTSSDDFVISAGTALGTTVVFQASVGASQGTLIQNTSGNGRLKIDDSNGVVLQYTADERIVIDGASTNFFSGGIQVAKFDTAGSKGNIALIGTGAFTSGVGVIHIGQAGTNPSGAPASGALLYVDASTGHLMARRNGAAAVDLTP